MASKYPFTDFQCHHLLCDLHLVLLQGSLLGWGMRTVFSLWLKEKNLTIFSLTPLFKAYHMCYVQTVDKDALKAKRTNSLTVKHKH